MLKRAVPWAPRLTFSLGVPRSAALFVVILTFVAVKGVYLALALPLFDFSDELFHFDYAFKLASGHGLVNIATDPISPETFETARIVGHWKKEGHVTPEGPGLVTPEVLESIKNWYKFDVTGGSSYEGVQPPLYYALAAVVIKLFPMDVTGDLQIQARSVRIFSLVLALAMTACTYEAGRKLTGRPAVGIGAMAFLAFVPLQSFMSIRISNDILGQLCVALLLLGIASRQGTGSALTGKDLVSIALPLTLAAATRSNAFLLCLALTFGYTALVMDGPLLKRVAWWVGAVIPGAVVGGLWFLRNFTLYGDPTGIFTLRDRVYIERPWVAKDMWDALAHNGGMLRDLILFPYPQFRMPLAHGVASSVWLVSLVVMCAAGIVDLVQRAVPARVSPQRLKFFSVPTVPCILLASYGGLALALGHKGYEAAILASGIAVFMCRRGLEVDGRATALSRLFLATAGGMGALVVSFSLNAGPVNERYFFSMAPLIAIFWAHAITRLLVPWARSLVIVATVGAFLFADIAKVWNLLAVQRSLLAI